MTDANSACEADWEEVGRCVLTPMDDKCSKWKDVFIEPELYFRMAEIIWVSKINAIRNEKKIMESVKGPHWRYKGESVIEEDAIEIQHYGSGSKKPGVYVCGDKENNSLLVTLRVFNLKKREGQFMLYGTLKGNGGALLKMKSEETFKLTGENESDERFYMRIDLPSDLQHFEGNSDWKVEEVGTGREYIICEHPRLEVFVVYGDPTNKETFPFYANGVWVEALRLMFRAAKVTGLREPNEISSEVTEYCYLRHGMIYETYLGRFCFFAPYNDANRQGLFYLMQYIKRKSLREQKDGPPPPENAVSCMDQAAAVQVFCGCLGVKVEWMWVQPFGYIIPTFLVGIKDQCNNPFFGNKEKYTESKMVPADQKEKRSKFGYHVFVKVCPDGFIRDACAGPHIGSENLEDYLKSSIQYDISLENHKDEQEMCKAQQTVGAALFISAGVAALNAK
jgi:hypothetical protein